MRVNQAEIAFFDQVEQRNAAIEVVLGDIHHQAQVVLDHFLPRREIAGARPARPVASSSSGVNRGLAPISFR